MHKFTPYLPFVLILIVGLFFRLHKLSVLTTFGRDQGIDFLEVKKMIVEKNPTLLGIKVSIADFHQGPVYLYLLIPLFLLLKFDPIAGAYTAVVIAIISIAAMYYTMQTFFDRRAALISSLLLAVSPEFVRYGNTPLYQHFLPLFLIAAMFCLLSFASTTQANHKWRWLIGLGFCVGLSLELHFLAITFGLGVLILLALQRSQRVIHMIAYVGGIGAGVLPTVVFELTHQFLNTQLLWQYVTSDSLPQTSRTLFDFVSPWVSGFARSLGADQMLLGWLILVMSVAAVEFITLQSPVEKITHQLFAIVSVVTLMFQFLLHSFEPHYLLQIWLLLLMLIPLWINQLRPDRKQVALFVLGLCVVLNTGQVIGMSRANHGYYMPNGWNLHNIKQVTQLIAADATGAAGLNVASMLDGDTRAYPLRYTLNVAGVQLDSEEAYPSSQRLYVVSTDSSDALLQATVWEIAGFGPKTVSQQWDVGNGIRLYRLEK